MTKVSDALKVVLADAFALYIKASNFHWNVTGSDFNQFHSIFGEVYEEVQESIDSIAEHIRTLDEFAPGSFARFSELTTIEDELNVPEAKEMTKRLLADNERMLKSLVACYKAATDADELGLQNFIQDRIDIHKKHSWKLRSQIK